MRITLCHIAIAWALVACGTGGPDATSSSGSSGTTSSGGSSSGAPQCGGTCESSASITFDENNDGGRLDGALVLACHRQRCAEGTLARSDAGTGYTLALESTVDGGGPNVFAPVDPAPAGNALRFRFYWSLGHGGANAPVDGDTYRLEARVSQLGQTLFDRSFTATYRMETVCGTMCKVYNVKP